MILECPKDECGEATNVVDECPLGECCRATREYQRGKRSLERGRNKKVRKG
jgi:hypothetical protein